jgi:hypothetical protein
VPRPNWSRPLPRTLIIPGGMTIRTLADVRTLISRVPKERRARATWQYGERQLAEAAAGEPGNVTASRAKFWRSV